jgi:hypothetical protein
VEKKTKLRQKSKNKKNERKEKEIWDCNLSWSLLFDQDISAWDTLQVLDNGKNV